MHISARRVRGSTALAAVFATLTGAAPASADPLAGAHYELGRGLQLPAMNLIFSGYGALRASHLEGQDTRLDLRDLSLFTIWQPAPRWQVFSEVEAESLFVVDGRGLEASDIEVAVERLYVDYAASDTLTLRAGRYLTPFGRWNLVHADPLVWTVSRPLVTQLAIPDHGSGAALLGSVSLGADTLDYTLYVDDSADLDPVNGEADFEDFDADGLSNDFRHAGGGQVRYHFFGERAELAASYASYRFADLPGRMHAAGLDGMLRWRRLELSGEFAWRDNGRRFEQDDWGGFAQAVVRLVGQIHGIGRIEHYRSGILERDVSRATLGLTWRPLPPLSFKLEYSAGTDRELAPDGVQMSFSMLF